MKKVLVVDDEKLIVKGLKFSLEQDDMEVDTAYDGGEAVEKIKNNDYDIVLLDIMIPVYTGIEVCQMVRVKSSGRFISTKRVAFHSLLAKLRAASTFFSI